MYIVHIFYSSLGGLINLHLSICINLYNGLMLSPSQIAARCSYWIIYFFKRYFRRAIYWK